MAKVTPEKYCKLYDELGSHAEVARYLGMNERSLRRWRKRNNVFTDEMASTVKDNKHPTALLTHIKKPRTISELSEKFDKSISTIEKWLKELSEEGYCIENHDGRCKLVTYATPSENEVNHTTTHTHLKIAIISDTHLCSTSQQLTHLNHFYDLCASDGITDIYHAGDLLAGVGVYRGQDDEIFCHTQDRQIEYAIENYPYRKGITTHIIAGNHDLVFLKRRGGNPLVRVALERDDINYLGAYSAWVKLAENCNMYLLHPDGGAAYSDSYKLQKLIESFEGGNKPNIAVMGHFHRRCEISSRNVYGLLGACFESQTAFLRRKGIQPRVGGNILEIDFNHDGSIQRFKTEFVNYLVPVEGDY